MFPLGKSHRGAIDAGKSGLVFIAQVRTLLYFDHFDVIKNFESVSAADQNYCVAGMQNSTLEIRPVRVIKIHPQTALLQAKHLLGEHTSLGTGLWTWASMVLPFGWRIKATLLRETLWSAEIHARLAKSLRQNDGHDDILMADRRESSLTLAQRLATNAPWNFTGQG
jgi:hypothetical protein